MVSIEGENMRAVTWVVERPLSARPRNDSKEGTMSTIAAGQPLRRLECCLVRARMPAQRRANRDVRALRLASW
jgi:hypothetical protein